MALSQNGWPALDATSSLLTTWDIPTIGAPTRVRLRDGSAGFLLCHFALWFDAKVEHLHGPVLDDWGYAYRPIRGETTGLSNHAAGCAIDLNATQHPLGEVGTFTRAQTAAIHTRLRLYGGAIRWGGDYTARKDEMHFEINVPLPEAEKVARKLLDSPRGKRLLAANPTQKKVILS